MQQYLQRNQAYHSNGAFMANRYPTKIQLRKEGMPRNASVDTIFGPFMRREYFPQFVCLMLLRRRSS